MVLRATAYLAKLGASGSPIFRAASLYNDRLHGKGSVLQDWAHPLGFTNSGELSSVPTLRVKVPHQTVSCSALQHQHVVIPDHKAKRVA